MISWLFEIDTLRLSTKDVTWNTTDYSGVILADSFSGITMRWNIAGNGLIAPNEMSFDVSNTDATYTTSQFEGKFCTVRLIEDDSNIRTWKFKIERAIAYYGKITCYCVDFLQEHLVGDYPNTKAPKEIWPSSDAESSDDYCVPVVLGTAYIPIRSVNTATQRFYVLGESGPTYTVHEVASPRQWPNKSIWSAASYNMNGYVNSGYQLLQPIIADSTGYGNADAPGLWRSGDTFYDMLCRFERSDTSALNNPAEWVEYVLEDFGVASADIDAISFAAAESTYDALTVGFDGGGWWKKEPRERVLSNLLAQTDSFIKCTDKVELYQFDKTPQETITNVLLLSFSPSKVTKVNNDSGRVHWPESFDKPSDILNGKAVVPTYGGGTENTPSSEILECRFLSGQSINAQKAGILYFQKKYEQSQRINFSVTFSSLTKKATLTPGQVVTVDNSLYGGTNNVIITDMTILPDMRVNFTGVVLNLLEDWRDLTTTTKDVITDTSMGFQLATTDYSGNVSSDWDLLLNIPQRFLDTATLGINVTDSYMGYYDGTNFTVYIDANGNMRAGDPDFGQGFVWNQSAGAYTISGSLTVQNPSGVRSDLNVADGADVTQVALNAGAAIDYAKANGKTLISGGYIDTTLLKVSDIIVTGGLMQIGDTAYDTARVNGESASTVKNNAAAGATFTSSSAGALAYKNLVGTAQLDSTIISGGYIRTSLIQTSAIVIGDLSGASTFTAYDTARVNGESASTVKNNAAAGATFTSSSYVTNTQAANITTIMGGSITTSKISATGGGYYDLTNSKIYFPPSASAGFIYFGSSSNYIIGNSTTGIELRSAIANVALWAKGGVKIVLVGDDYSFQPDVDIGCNLGTATRKWNWGRFAAVSTNLNAQLDTLDDLQTLHAIKPTDTGIMDFRTIPKRFTTYDDVFKAVKKDNGKLMQNWEIEAELMEKDGIGDNFIGLNLGAFVALVEGAVRQLDRENSATQFEMLEWINSLENRFKTIENKIKGEKM
jgi:hypothetical protein